MARPKEFDRDQALDAAIDVFREHGFEGTSADMLTKAMKIGRQSLYDTFGDKWQLYCASLQRYAAAETEAHVAALRSGSRAIDGVRALLERVVKEAGKACLGIGSICEFGRSREALAEIHDAAARTLQTVVARRIREAQIEGDVGHDLDPEDAAKFVLASVVGIRIAARSGAKARQVQALGQLALRALR